MNLILKVYIITLLIHFNVALYAIPNFVETQTSASYTVMLIDNNVKPKECNLSDSSVTYSVNLKESGAPLVLFNSTIQPETNSTEENILTSLGYGICGFKLENVSGTNYVSVWNMSFIDENDIFYSRTVGVRVEGGLSETIKEYVPVGGSFSIFCLSNTMHDVFFCELYNPQGKVVLTNKECSTNIKISKLSDFGTWTCAYSNGINMIPSKKYFNIIEKINNVNTWHNETNTHVNIGCSIENNIIGFVDFCLFVKPDGKSLIVKEGLATSRYTALQTNISKATCGLEIKKPLEQYEKGVWRCEYVSKLDGPIGGFINLSEDQSQLPPPEIPKQIITHVNEILSITCRVPYSLPYCTIFGPNHPDFPSQNSRALTLGLCQLELTATMHENGKWKCAFGRNTGEPDEVYSFDVIVHEDVIKAEESRIESVIGQTVFLNCSTEGYTNYPIQYCRFSHNDKTYNINPEKSSDRMSYNGRGFKYGDCGIKLQNLQDEDKGQWTCITRTGINFENSEIRDNIDLVILNSFKNIMTLN